MLLTLSLHQIFSVLVRQVLMNVCSLFVVSFIVLHVSDPYSIIYFMLELKNAYFGGDWEVFWAVDLPEHVNHHLGRSCFLCLHLSSIHIARQCCRHNLRDRCQHKKQVYCTNFLKEDISVLDREDLEIVLYVNKAKRNNISWAFQTLQTTLGKAHWLALSTQKKTLLVYGLDWLWSAIK